MTSLLSKIKLLMVALAMLLIPSLTTPAYAAEVDGNIAYVIGSNGILYALTSTETFINGAWVAGYTSQALGSVSNLLSAISSSGAFVTPTVTCAGEATATMTAVLPVATACILPAAVAMAILFPQLKDINENGTNSIYWGQVVQPCSTPVPAPAFCGSFYVGAM